MNTPPRVPEPRIPRRLLRQRYIEQRDRCTPEAGDRPDPPAPQPPAAEHDRENEQR